MDRFNKINIQKLSEGFMEAWDRDDSFDTEYMGGLWAESFIGNEIVCGIVIYIPKYMPSLIGKISVDPYFNNDKNQAPVTDDQSREMVKISNEICEIISAPFRIGDDIGDYASELTGMINTKGMWVYNSQGIAVEIKCDVLGKIVAYDVEDNKVIMDNADGPR